MKIKDISYILFGILPILKKDSPMPKLKTLTHEYKGLLSITMELETRIFSFTG
jgi:hypothetical protein